MGKMNVRRAVQVVSRPVNVTLELLKEQAGHTCGTSFAHIGPTVVFMDAMYRWFTLMDVSNCTQHVHQNNPDCKQYESKDYRRLGWLETSFFDYLAEIKQQSPAKNFLTKETYIRGLAYNNHLKRGRWFRSAVKIQAGWLGRFDQFIEDGDEDFQSYVERFDHFLKAFQVSDDLKVSVFITAIGKKAYKTLKTLLEPEKPENKTYAQLVQTLKEQYVPKTFVIAERFKFSRCFQQDGQAVTAFAVELKQLATSCDFGTFLDDALRDRFVAGLCDKETQAELLKTSKLAFKEACGIARSIELAWKESQDFQPKSAQGMISTLNRKTDSGKRPPRWREETSGMPTGTRGAEPLHCFRCGSEHEAPICKLCKYHCWVCKQVGHLAKMCRDRGRDAANVIDEQSDAGEHVLYNIYSCEGRTRLYEICLKLDQKSVRMQIDTGASVSIVPESLCKKYWPSLPLEPCSLKLKTYGGTPLTVKGKLNVSVEHNGQHKQLSLIVVKTNESTNTMLLGRDWLSALKLDWASVHGVGLDKVALLL
ncbi:uncharacterized protein LOC142772051 [Rhipicephalus microplus]|uniref:uncharacterized protein LOC142772051 n=1 Tax=Rhipicephalus microplus TaxID=6941 RepID=UPI003F6BF4FD